MEMKKLLAMDGNIEVEVIYKIQVKSISTFNKYYGNWFCGTTNLILEENAVIAA
jgi:hypothetical protein